jgi:hypothetical protein
MVQICSKHESKGKCSRIGRMLCKLNGQAWGRGKHDICTGIIVFEFTDLSKHRTAAIRQGNVSCVACLLWGDSEAEGEAIASPAFIAWCLLVIFRAGALPPVLLDIGGNPDVPPPIPVGMFLCQTFSYLSFHASCNVVWICLFLVKIDHLEPPS